MRRKTGVVAKYARMTAAQLRAEAAEFDYQPDILKRSPDPTEWWSFGTPKTPEFARWLMQRGPDPKRRNWLGITLLNRCAAKGDTEMAQVCLDFGADIDAIETHWSSTPLGWAARHSQSVMVEWLLKKGANPNLPVDEPWALPLEWAKRRGHHEIIELLRQSAHAFPCGPSRSIGPTRAETACGSPGSDGGVAREITLVTLRQAW